MVRISANGQVLPAFKARTVDARQKTHQAYIHKSDLKTYTPEKPRPSKFVEGPASPKPKIDEATTASKKSSAAPRLGSIVAGTVASDSYNQPTISLSELLASQSSNREDT